MGEQPDAAGERSLSYIVDLDGVRHSTRSKKDLAQREKDLVFGLRAIDRRRWPHLMGNDMLLQHLEYARVIEEQTQTRPSAREKAYQSCGIIDRIGSLNISNDSDKLKLLLTGSAFTGIKKSLTLDDFEAIGFPVALGREPDVDSNRNLSMALKNLQVTMIVYYSTAFAESFSGILADLEGYSRPLELVTASYLHHSIEMTLSKFFRVVRTQKGTEDPTLSLNSPESCAEYLVALLLLLSKDLSNHAERSRMEEYYLLRTRKEEVSGKKLKKEKSCPSKNVKFEKDAKQDKEVAKDEVGASKKMVQVCASHLGNQIGAINERTNAIFVCAAGSKCRFSHATVKDKSIKELEEIIAKMPFTMRPMLSAAAKKKST